MHWRQSEGRVFVRRRAREAYRNNCVVLTVKFGGGGVTLWDTMSYRGTVFLTPLKGNLKKDDYLDILSKSAIVVVWKWPPHWPDFSGIENLWRDFEEVVSNEGCHHLKYLHQALVNEWNQIPVSKYQRVIQNMPNRIRTVRIHTLLPLCKTDIPILKVLYVDK